MRIHPLPLWERYRGDGPITRILARREADRERLRNRRMFETEQPSRGFPNGADGNRRVGARPTADSQVIRS